MKNTPIQNKYDFAVLVTVTKANPNGDPLADNIPRVDFDGYGEMSDVCIKRKIRNRIQDFGEKIFVQSNDRCDDGATSLAERVVSNATMKQFDGKDENAYAAAACDEWYDVRAFGQLFAFQKGISVGVRGPVAVQTAVSVDPVSIASIQITKSVNGTAKESGRSSDTFGRKDRVEFGLYVIRGSINPQLAEKTGFSDDDAAKLLEALQTLFVNDSSAARPDGSMEVQQVYWWKHNCKNGQYSSAKVQRTLSIQKKVDEPKSFDDYTVTLNNLEGLEPEVYQGW